MASRLREDFLVIVYDSRAEIEYQYEPLETLYTTKKNHILEYLREYVHCRDIAFICRNNVDGVDANCWGIV